MTVAAAPRSDTSQTLDRGLRILESLAEAPDGLSVTELAEMLGVHRTIVYRLVGTLADHRLVTRSPDTRYRLGAGVVRLARAVAPRLQSVALPELSRLADELGATAFLTVRDGDDGVALATVEPRHTHFHVGYRTGFRHPLTRGASGIAILAAGPPVAGERPEVAEARSRGYAVSRGELQKGASGIAAPVAAPASEAAACVGVVVLGDLDEETAAPRVMSAARAIAAELA